MVFIDDYGYERQEHKHSSLIHRQIAYHEIYLKHREDYPLPFSCYIIHHKNKNKTDNRIENLQILEREEHDEKHKDIIEEKQIYVEVLKNDKKRHSILISGVIWWVVISVILGWWFGSIGWAFSVFILIWIIGGIVFWKIRNL